MKESQIQKQIIEYLSIIASSTDILFFSIPNESLMAAMIMFGVPDKTRYKLINHFKKMGLTPGIPDLCILGNKKTVFIEVKKPGQKVNRGQQIIHDAIGRAGHSVWTVFNVEDVKDVLNHERLV